jgi:nicotinamide riboside kinase
MIVSFTGAQSTGKTTLLNRLVEKNPNVTFVEEVTRRVKRLYDVPINEDGGDVTQFLIMADHVQNLFSKDKSDLTVFDRCAVDGVVYTRWLQLQGMVSAEVYSACCKIYDAIIDQYDVIFYTDPADVKLVDDGERSVNVDFRNDIIKLFNDKLEGLDNVVVLSGSVEERLNIVKKTVEGLGKDIII